jgi:hypothetical protein
LRNLIRIIGIKYLIGFDQQDVSRLKKLFMLLGNKSLNKAKIYEKT